MPKRPNILLILTDQQRYPTPYESPELTQFRRDEFTAETALNDTVCVKALPAPMR